MLRTAFLAYLARACVSAARPATDRTRRGEATQIATIDTATAPIATQNAPS